MKRINQFHYFANVRLPTEKAHGLQIMQNCEAVAEAFADELAGGAAVTLWAARRVQPPTLRDVDPFAYYGVRENFALRRLPTLDFVGAAGAGRWARLAFAVQTLTYLLALCFTLLFHLRNRRGAVAYTRDERVVFVLGLFFPRARIGYEPHQLAAGRGGRWLQTAALRRAGAIFPVTRALADDLIARGADPARITVAHDGIRRARFDPLPAQAEARKAAGWPGDAFIIGYVGRLQTLAMDKGVGTLIEAVTVLQAQGVRAALALVGGPDEIAADHRQHWAARSLRLGDFLYAGQVAPGDVPRYLAAFDVCAMPLPNTAHFARHASPIKLFEYMASGRPLVASDLPAFAEVIAEGETALLVAPSDPAAWAAAITRLHADPTLRERLAERARALVFQTYTWDARARLILEQFR